jgi:nicotinamidase-related amidase
MKPALLIIDMQKKFFEFGPAFKQSLEEATEYINAAITLFREKNLPIFVIEHSNKEDGLMPGTPGFPTHESINLASADVRITKTYGNSFTKTALAEKLRGGGIDSLIITGFCAEYCVLSTYRGAQDYDFVPFILRDSLASDNREHIRFVEDISEVVSFGALRLLLSTLT